MPTLPSPLPTLGAGDPSELVAFAKTPGDKARYEALALGFRTSADWGSVVKLNIFHAQALADDERAADLMLAAAELAAERLGNRTVAAHALALAWVRRGDHIGLGLKLLDHYRALGWQRERLLLLDYLLEHETGLETTVQSKLHLEAADVQWEYYQALGSCLEHLRRAIELDAKNRDAVAREIELYLLAGAWEKAALRLRQDLEDAQTQGSTDRVSQIHVQLAYVEREANRDPANAARHLQLALEANPGSLAALQMLGELFTHARAGDERIAPIYIKTARAALKVGDEARAKGLCWRTLELDPLNGHAIEVLTGILERTENWNELDRLLAHRIEHVTDENKRAELLLERAKMLETNLQKSYQAELCYERARQAPQAQARAQAALQRLARENLDHFYLVEILERELANQGDAAPLEVLAEIAKLQRDVLEDPSRAALYDYKILEREIFHEGAAESYKEHFRRRHSWAELRDLLAFRIDQAEKLGAHASPLGTAKFAEEYAELADLSERRLGDLEGALDAWRRLARIYPEDLRPQEHIARIEKRVVMWDNMLESLESELARATEVGKRIELLRRLTQIYRDRYADPARAIELYRELLQLTPEDQQSRRALLGLYERAGDHKAVVATLQEQCERAQAGAETASYLRRVIDLCQHQLEDLDQALAACERLIAIAPKSVDALRRLQQIYLERGNFAGFSQAVLRECELLIKPETKAPALRRLARVQLSAGLIDEAIATLSQVQQLFPQRLECADRLLSVQLGFQRHQAALNLLEKLADSPHVPLLRRVDYLGQLGEVALEHEADTEVASRTFERVLTLSPHDQRALLALRSLYEKRQNHAGLSKVLERLIAQTPFDDERQLITRERARLLGGPLAQPAEAAKTLRSLQKPLLGHPRELISEILEHLQKTDSARACAAQFELLLLGETQLKARKEAYQALVGVWRKAGETLTALAVHRRHLAESPGDLDAISQLAELQLELNDVDGALATLEEYCDALAEPSARIAVLNRLSELAETHEQIDRALGYQRRAIELDLENDGQWEVLGGFCERHGAWPMVLQLMQQRADNRQNLGDLGAMRQICVIAAQLAEDRLDDPRLALWWFKRDYLAALDDSPERLECEELLQALVERRRFHSELLEIWQADIEMRQRKAAPETVYCGLDLEGAYLRAAKLAREKVRDPERAVALLMQGWRELDESEALALAIEDIASAHNLWQPLLDVQDARLLRRTDPNERWEVYRKLASVLVDRAGEPLRAFNRLRDAWREFNQLHLPVTADDGEHSLAQQSHLALLDLGQRFELWDPLAVHLVEIARGELSAGRTDSGLSSLLHAVEIYHEQLDRPLEALRLLVPAVLHDPAAERILPKIRSLAAQLHRDTDPQTARLGALIELEALTRQLAVAQSSDAIFDLLRERAALREAKLVSRFGALAEWLRVVQMRPDDSQARSEIARLCESAERANFALFLPAWDLQNATSLTERLELLRQIADIYEEHLGRPEYAMRCRLQAWRADPFIPDIDNLDEDTKHLWRLAERVGAYRGPALPEEGLLFPRIPVPEREDLAAWEALELDPASFFNDDRSAIAVDVATPTKSDDAQELELSDADVIEEVNEDSSTAQADDDDASSNFELARVEHEGEEMTIALTPMGRAPKAPPLRLGQIVPGHPAVPYLTSPILPARPRVDSAWHEVATTYESRPNTDLVQEVALLRATAKMWEQSAQRVEQAFETYERALTRAPGQSLVLQELEDLAARHQQPARLRRSLMLLLQRAKSKDVAIDLSLRLARMHASEGDTGGAEQYFRHIVSLDAQHIESLQALCEIYHNAGRYADHAEVYAQLLDVQRYALDDNERIARAMHLVELYANELGQRSDAIAALRFLLDDFPRHLPAQERLVELLLVGQQWAQAIEAMRSAIESGAPTDLELRFLQKIAEVYADHMHLPDRAIEAWQAIREREPEHALAFDRLRQLLQSTHRHDQLIRLVEETLARRPNLAPAIRRELLLDKAEAEYARSPHDPSGALAVLHQVQNQEAMLPTETMRAADLLLMCNDAAAAQALLRQALKAPASELSADDRGRLVDALLQVLKDSGAGARVRLDEVLVQLALAPQARTLIRLRMQLARELGETAHLMQALEAANDAEGWIEAGELALRDLQDPARAQTLFERVLDDLRRDPTTSSSKPSLREQAILGLARAYIGQRKLDAAVAVIDAQVDDRDSARSRARLLAQVGYLLLQQNGEPAVLRQLFTKALELDPAQVAARIGLGRLLHQAGDSNQAEEHLVAALDQLEIEPQGLLIAQASLALAEILEATQRENEAHRRLLLAQRVAPEDLKIRTALAENRFRAGKWREVLAAAETLDQRLAVNGLIDADALHDAVKVQVLAARAEMAVHRQSQAIERLERALALDPSHVEAREAMIEILMQSQRTLRASQQLRQLAASRSDNKLALRDWIRAASLGLDALRTASPDEQIDSTQELSTCLSALSAGLKIAQDWSAAELQEQVKLGLFPLEELERCVVQARHLDPSLAARGVLALAHASVKPSDRVFTLLLAASNDANATTATPEQRQELVRLAVRCAQEAVRIRPDSALAARHLAQSLEHAASDHPELQVLLNEALKRYLDRLPSITQEREAALELLRRAGNSRHSAQDLAHRALTKVAELAPHMLTVNDRLRILEWDDQEAHGDGKATASSNRYLANLQAILELAPHHRPSLQRWAQNLATRDLHDRARQAYHLLSILDPAHKPAHDFLAAHPITAAAPHPFDLAGVLGTPAPDAGIPAALLLLLEGAGDLLLEHFAADGQTNPPAAGTDGPVRLGEHAQRAWQSVVSSFGETPAPARLRIDPHAISPLRVELALSPTLVIGTSLAETADDRLARFWFAYGLAAAQPQSLLSLALMPRDFAELISALLLAFHPRHTRRRLASRDEGERATRLGLHLARRVPMRIARQIERLFKAHESEAFDTRVWRSWCQQACDRVGLAVGGSLTVAIEALQPHRAHAELAQVIAQDDRVRSLVAFYLSESYARARRQFGEVVGTP